MHVIHYLVQVYGVEGKVVNIKPKTAAVTPINYARKKKEITNPIITTRQQITTRKIAKEIEQQEKEKQ